jgi:hypothetical protein
MIGHEAEGMAAPIVALVDMLESIEKVQAVGVIPEHRFLLVPARGDMIDCAGIFYSEGACHTGATIAKNTRNVKLQDVTLKVLQFNSGEKGFKENFGFFMFNPDITGNDAGDKFISGSAVVSKFQFDISECSTKSGSATIKLSDSDNLHISTLSEPMTEKKTCCCGCYRKQWVSDDTYNKFEHFIFFLGFIAYILLGPAIGYLIVRIYHIFYALNS